MNTPSKRGLDSETGLFPPAVAEEIKGRKPPKRKRVIGDACLDTEGKTVLVDQCRSEIASLIKYYHEDGGIQFEVDIGKTQGVSGGTRRSGVAVMIEESSLPFSSLVSQVLDKLGKSDDIQWKGDVTLASLRSIVLSIGERISFGIPKPDADVLEDTCDSCLWRWEVRDLKLLPEAQRSSIAARRRKRRKISERLAALSAMIAALTVKYDPGEEQAMLSKAEAGLLKTENEALIRATVNQWQKRKTAQETQKEVKMKEKENFKEQQLIDRENEKEQKRLQREEDKKKLQQEKEKERLEKEASRERVRIQKETLRQEKELKRQQEETEKVLRRKEKEVADFKRQNALQKQACIMDRFLQSKKDQGVSGPGAEVEADDSGQALLWEPAPAKITYDMDQEMLKCSEKSIENLMSFHVAAWKNLGKPLTITRVQRWGLRRLPKMSAFSELRLQGGSGDAVSDGGAHVQPKARTMANSGSKRSCKELEDGGMQSDKMESDWEETGCMAMTDLLLQDDRSDSYKILHLQSKRRKLLQFDRSHRPAFYGSFSKKSETVRPRNPLKTDSNLDYEVDSDEEWEEEDPGESLSDCEKDEEDEKIDAEDDEENADGFVVPDGYLSESEGAQVDDADSDSDTELSVGERSLKATGFHDAQWLENDQGLQMFARQRKILEHLTDQALRSNRPYMICNFNQDSLSKASKTERLCLEALRISPMTPEVVIEVPVQEAERQEQEKDTLQCRKPKLKKLLPDSALPEMVEILLSSSHGLKKTVDILSLKFSTVSRSQLKNKIKEICDFVDNHWQVKKEIVEQVGLQLPPPPPPPPPPPHAPSIPENVNKSPAIQLKPITKFFSKRCLPPEQAGFSDSSPEKIKESGDAMKSVRALEEVHQNYKLEAS